MLGSTAEVYTGSQSLFSHTFQIYTEIDGRSATSYDLTVTLTCPTSFVSCDSFVDTTGQDTAEMEFFSPVACPDCKFALRVLGNSATPLSFNIQSIMSWALNNMAVGEGGCLPTENGVFVFDTQAPLSQVT